MYQIEITNSAHHHLRNLNNSIRQRIHEAIEHLSQNPRPYGVKKLQGEVDFYRIRVGNYRVLYIIDDSTKTVTIMRIMPRENAY
ncbi:MAG: type II toxin-antitoxin system RelE/ParE family toxin [Dehalococcoidales bacterium]|nr:type II toxin-antitoxin system RelE/ParE family toxin [Dehalococcoidales bacterium]